MRLTILQTRDDPAGDLVAAALREEVSLRLALGEEAPRVAFHGLDMVVVWSASAAQRGWAAFAPYAPRQGRLIFALMDGMRLPSDAPAGAVGVAFGPRFADLTAEARVARSARPAMRQALGLTGFLAGVLAAFGLFSPSAGVNAAPQQGFALVADPETGARSVAANEDVGGAVAARAAQDAYAATLDLKGLPETVVLGEAGPALEPDVQDGLRLLAELMFAAEAPRVATAPEAMTPIVPPAVLAG